MNSFQTNLLAVQAEITQIAATVQRNPETILVLAVSKNQPPEAIAAAIKSGQRAFGENYGQAGVEKICYWRAFKDPQPLQWHFIGQLQRNKIRLIATYFDWVQTIATLAHAQQLSYFRALTTQRPLQVLIQVNLRSPIEGYGVLPEAFISLAQAVQQLPHLCLRGLMVLPAPTANPPQIAALFGQAQALFQALQAHHPQVDTLSMGMSNDLSNAIAAGSTLVRLGTALFGPRLVNRG
jgi:pyridoxal phosphate enzyme (YggS family)